jgi:hypothetical protein
LEWLTHHTLFFCYLVSRFGFFEDFLFLRGMFLLVLRLDYFMSSIHSVYSVCQGKGEGGAHGFIYRMGWFFFFFGGRVSQYPVVFLVSFLEFWRGFALVFVL